MYFDPYMAQRLAEEYMKERRREAEQARLLRAAEGPRKTREWWLPAALIMGALLGLIVLQP